MNALQRDPSPEVRQRAVPILLRLADRDARARPALAQAASEDADPLVRLAAAAALRGEAFQAGRSRKSMRRRARRAAVPAAAGAPGRDPG